MSKKKSTVCLVLITILLAVVCAMTFVSFPIPGTVKDYNSILSNVGLGTDVGGSYYTVYYPEGVLSKEEYESQYDVLPEDKKASFADKYDAHGDLYVEHGLVGDAFLSDLSGAVSVISDRYETMGIAGYTVSIYDDYTIRVTLPSSTQNPEQIFDLFSYEGDFSLGESAGVKGFGANRYHKISEYFKGASAHTRDHTPFLQIDMTETGSEKVVEYSSKLIENANSNSTDESGNPTQQQQQTAKDVSIYFNVGDNSIANMVISESIGSDSIFISGYNSEEQAKAVATLLDSVIKGNTFDLVFTVGSVYTAEATYGENATIILLVVLGVLTLAMAIYFIVVYRGIGAAHLYAFLTYALLMIILLASVPSLFVTVSSLPGVLFSAALLVGTNLAIFARIKKEFDLGKTISASVKLGYEKSLYPTLELHIALAVFALLGALIGVTELHLFAFTFGVGVLLSGVCTLLLTRFFWHIMMNHAKNQFTFCNWKREEIDDED